MPQVTITLPGGAARILDALHAAGYGAYVVGGCVRDSLLGRTPGDWDICTAARPDAIRAVFADRRLLLTGEKHGTVTVMDGAIPYEITTYRQDGGYSDGRHPDRVRFVPDLHADLARRDFTVNAMAYAPGAGLVDDFGGVGDLAAKIIRCVGDPAARFGEDALRVLRAPRFAAQLGFALDPETAAAALAARDGVGRVSPERCFAELDKLLAGAAAGRALAEYGGILAGEVPEIEPCIGCTQPGVAHRYDVWGHTAQAVAMLNLAGLDARSARVLRWAALLHDIAKPLCRTTLPDGRVRFPGHNQRGGQLARKILTRLRAPRYLIDGVGVLVEVHDRPLPVGDAAILHALHARGPLFWQRLARLKCADLDAHAPIRAVLHRRDAAVAFEVRMSDLAETGCYALPMLKVGGSDVLEAGVPPGPGVGRTLENLLDRVMDGTLPNTRPALLAALAEMQAEGGRAATDARQ